MGDSNSRRVRSGIPGHNLNSGYEGNDSGGHGVFVPLSAWDITTEEYKALWDGLVGTGVPDPGIDSVLDFLPELEAEIIHLFCVEQKSQKEIAEIMKLSQSTVSYRMRRTREKLRYLLLIKSIDVQVLVDSMVFLREGERKILFDLIHRVNQDQVGKANGVRQSTVKWILTKTIRRLSALEIVDSDAWQNQLGLVLLLEASLKVRVS